MITRSLAKHSYIFIVVFFLGILTFLAPVNALTIKPKSDFNIAEATNKQAESFNLPTSIIVAPITLPSDLVIQNSEWYEGIYYYMATRLNQGDFLAHYFMSKDGQIFAGNSNGEEQRINLEDPEGNNPIVIMYLADKGQSDFTLSAKPELAELILDIANRNAIKLNAIQLRALTFSLAPETPLTLTPEQMGGLFEISLKQIVTEITPKYSPIIKSYKIELVGTVLPATAVNYGENAKVKLTIKNNSAYTLYQGTDYEPILTKEGKNESIFFLNRSWLSQTQTAVMSEGSLLKPQESKEFDVQINVPLYFGEQNEKFYLTNALGETYPASETTVSLTINKPSFSVVEITNTETGQLNVRDGPWASSSIISRVTPGQRYIVMETTTSGYTKLDLGSGKSGWVVSRYTKKVS